MNTLKIALMITLYTTIQIGMLVIFEYQTYTRNKIASYTTDSDCVQLAGTELAGSEVE